MLTSRAGDQLTAAAHFFLAKPAGEDIDLSQLQVYIKHDAVPVTEMLLERGVVSVYQPSRRFAVTRPVDEAGMDWLKEYLELIDNIETALVDAGDPKTGRHASFAIVPRQPKNINRAVISVDRATLLPVRFEVQFPLRKQIVAFERLKVGQPIDPKVFAITLPPGQQWTQR